MVTFYTSLYLSKLADMGNTKTTAVSHTEEEILIMMKDSVYRY